MSAESIGEPFPVVKDSMRKYKELLKRNEKNKFMAESVSQSGCRKSKGEEKKIKEKSWNQGTQLNQRNTTS